MFPDVSEWSLGRVAAISTLLKNHRFKYILLLLEMTLSVSYTLNEYDYKMLMIAIRSYLEGIISILLISSTSTSLRCYPINDGFQNSCHIISFPQRLTVLFSEGMEHRMQITLVQWESSRRGCKWVRSKSCIQQTFPIVQKALSGGEGIEQDRSGLPGRSLHSSV